MNDDTWRLDVDTRLLSKGSRSAKLTKTEVAVVGLLMSAHDHTVSRDALWRTMTKKGSPAMLGVVMCNLKRKIRDAIGTDLPIITKFDEDRMWCGPTEVSIAAVVVPGCAVQSLRDLLRTHPDRNGVEEFSHVVFGA